MQSSLDRFLVIKNKLPSQVNGFETDIVRKINKSIIIHSEDIKKKRKLTRGKYKQLRDEDKFGLARAAHRLGSPTDATKTIKYHHLNASANSVRGWKVSYENAMKTLGREPKDAAEAGLVGRKRDIGFIASKYKMRCKLTKRKYKIDDALDINADETNTDMVPISQYTMDKKGAKHVVGEKMDDKRNITCMLGGAKSGEAMKCQYINKGTTTRCHPKFEEEKIPDNMYMDHSYNTWSDEETIMNFAKDVVVPFKNAQIKKYDLPENSHALLRWDIYYIHLYDSVIKYLLSNNIHVVIVPPNTTDDLQQMDVGVNAGFKYKLKLCFTEERAQKSIDELLTGHDCNDIHMDYHLSALKNKHVRWVAQAWKYCEDKELIKKSFDMVEDNCVGYKSWNDNCIANEYCKRNAKKWEKELKILTSGKHEIESDSDDEDDDIKTNIVSKKKELNDNPQEIAFYKGNRNNNKNELIRTFVIPKPKKKKGKKKSKKKVKKKIKNAPKKKKGGKVNKTKKKRRKRSRQEVMDDEAAIGVIGYMDLTSNAHNTNNKRAKR